MAVLDQDHETLEDAAHAAIEACWAEYEKRAKFIVAGQVRYSDGYIDADDVKASRIALGPFPTRGQAEKAGYSLAYSHSTGEQAKWGVFSMWNSTPSAWYKQRKKRADLAGGEDLRPRELRQRFVEQWFEQHPGASNSDLPEHLQGNGWDGLDSFMEWYEEFAGQCAACDGTGRIDC